MLSLKNLARKGLKNPLKKSLVVLAWLDRQSDQHNDTQKAARAWLNMLLFE